MNEARERREREEREASERQEQEARDRGDTATADAISRAREKGVSNNYGQRDRYIERESERIQDALRQDRTDSAVRQAAVERGDTDFVSDIDRARERRYGKDTSAVESDRRRYDATLDPATIERRAEGQRGDQLQGEELSQIYQAAQLDPGEHTNADGSKTIVNVDSLGNRQVKVYKRTADGGEYLGYSVTVGPDDTLSVQTYDQYGNIAGSAVAPVGDGLFNQGDTLHLAVNPGLTPEQLAAQDSQVWDFLESRDYDTHAMSIEDAYAEYNRLVGASRVQAQGDAAPVYAYLAQRGYDIASMSIEEAYAEYNRLEKAAQVQSVQLLEHLEGQYTEAVGNNDLKELADLADSGAGDALIVKQDDGTTTTYTQFLRSETRRLSEFNRMQSGEFDTDPDHDAQAQITQGKIWDEAVSDLSRRGMIDDETDDAEIHRILQAEGAVREALRKKQLQGLTDAQFALDLEGRSVSSMVTGAPIVVDQDTGGVFTGAAAVKKGLRDTAQQREDLADYLTLNNPEGFTTEQLLDMAHARHQLLGDLDDYETNQALARTLDADKAAGQWETDARDAGLVKSFPVGGGRIVTLNMVDLDTKGKDFLAAEKYAFTRVTQLHEDGLSPKLVDANRELAGLDAFAKESKDLQEDIALDEKYERESTEQHTFQTADGQVVVSGKAIATHDGEEKYHKARDFAAEQSNYGATPEIKKQGQDSLQKLNEVLNLWQHPEVVARKRRLAVAGGIGLLTLPLAPLAVATGGLVGGAIGAGFSTVPALLPSEGEGWGNVSGDEWQNIRSGAVEGFLFGSAGGGLNSLALSGLTRAGGMVSKGRSMVKVKGSDGKVRTLRLADGDPVPLGAKMVQGNAMTSGGRILSQWAPKQAVSMGTGAGLDIGTYLLPDKFGKVRITGKELVDVGVGAALDPIVDRGLAGAGRTAKYGLRTFGPSKVSLLPSIGGYKGLALPGPGGFDRVTMPATKVPQLLGPESPEFSDFAHDAFSTVQKQGNWTGVVDGRQVTFTEGRMAEAFRQANPDVPLWYHSSPRTDILATGPPVIHKEGVGAQENFLFGSIEPVGKFQLGAAYGGRGEAPGTVVYPDSHIWQRVVDDQGNTKYYRRGYEGEEGIPEAVDIPVSERVVSGGPNMGGSILAAEGVTVPSYPARVRANILGLGDRLPIVGSDRGGFVVGDRVETPGRVDGAGRSADPDAQVDGAGRSADPDAQVDGAGRSADPDAQVDGAGRSADPDAQVDGAGRSADPDAQVDGAGRSADPDAQVDGAGRSADPDAQSADPDGRVNTRWPV